MKLLAWGLTDVGQKRDHNEDAFLVNSELCLFAVADGMGGHQGGDRASRLAVEIMEREIRRACAQNAPLDPTDNPPSSHLRGAAKIAGRTIYSLAQRDPQLSGMGTTLTTLFFHSGRAYLAHVGDSRAYLFRNDQLEQLTEDHSWIEEQIRSGFMTMDEARDSTLKHIITRSVGFEYDVEVDQLNMPVLTGDCFLLCSDGLSNSLLDEELRRMLSDGYYSEVPRKMVDLVNKKGGDDNITVVVVYIANALEQTEEQAEAIMGEEAAKAPQIQALEAAEDAAADEFDPYAITMAAEDNPLE